MVHGPWMSEFVGPGCAKLRGRGPEPRTWETGHRVLGSRAYKDTSKALMLCAVQSVLVLEVCGCA